MMDENYFRWYWMTLQHANKMRNEFHRSGVPTNNVTILLENSSLFIGNIRIRHRLKLCSCFSAEVNNIGLNGEIVIHRSRLLQKLLNRVFRCKGFWLVRLPPKFSPNRMSIDKNCPPACAIHPNSVQLFFYLFLCNKESSVLYRCSDNDIKITLMIADKEFMPPFFIHRLFARRQKYSK